MTDRSVSRKPPSQSHERDYRTAIGRGIKRRVTSPPWLARAAGVGLCGVSIGFVLVFLLLLEIDGELALITRPLPMRIALALPSLVAVFLLGTTIGAILAWRNRYWSLRARIHQTVLAILGIGFVWQLAALGFITY